MSFIMRILISALLHKTVNVPGILFSDAHAFTTSTSGTTIATMQLYIEKFKLMLYLRIMTFNLLSNFRHVQILAQHIAI